MSLKLSDFVHLHNHTQYSLLDGLTKIPDLVSHIKNNGMDAVAKTDHGTLSGTIDFFRSAKSNNIKPIIGMETYVASRGHKDKDPAKDKQRFHLILIAMNNEGYKNLMKLASIAHLEGFYYFPRIDHSLLEKYNEGLIVLSACMGSELGQAFKNQQFEQAESIAKWYKSVFKDRYYLEVQDHGHKDNPMYNEEQGAVNQSIIELGRRLDIPVVVTCDAHYLKHEDQDAHEVLLCVGTGSFISETNRMSLKEFPLHVETAENIIKRWGKDFPDLVKNTRKIADRCDINIDLDNILIPKFPVPKGETDKSYLHKLVYSGLVNRYAPDEASSKEMDIEQVKKVLPEEILHRAEYELGVIDSMGFNGYFLIVQDFINWGKSQGIVFGPGRGSAAGSIVSYATRITELDPLKYDLLFERFLNPERISMPDIDIDIQDTRRNEVIEYCANKYGRNQVANIVTFGTMAARASVRDVARVLEVPYSEADRIAKMIPPPVQGRHIPLATSIVEDEDLKREYDRNEQSKKVIDLAIRLEGTIRSHGVHAAGVVIAPEDITNYTPLEVAQKGSITTQYSMGPVEQLGLLKMDFLGLSNLTIINNAIKIIERVYEVKIDLDSIPLDDSKTFELFQRGDTTGVFQLESAGMKRYLKELRPSEFDDIIAMVALYRPGPMQFIESFIRRKHGDEEITYLHPKMESALASTYGVLVYQEQFMQISKDLSGFTGGQADTLRKAVGKKNKEMMTKIKPEFIDGAVNNSGASRVRMEKFWDQLEEFANYCFNKSHAACYGLIAYWTAYLKAHYPDAFMASLMTSAADDTDRLAVEIDECNQMGIKVLPPDINESYSAFAVVPGKNQIRFGLSAIKNVGSGAVEEILSVRRDKRFADITDVFSRLNPKIVNKKSIESLVKSGAFDTFSDRDVLLENADSLLSYASRIQRDNDMGQVGLFGESDLDTRESVELALKPATVTHSTYDRLRWERELLGLYISAHPLDSYKAYLDELTIPMSAITTSLEGRSLSVGGIVESVKEIITKKGQKMAFVTVRDLSDSMEFVLFPSVYQKTVGIWIKDKVVLINGKVGKNREEESASTDLPSMIVEDAREITPEQAESYEPVGKKKKIPKTRKAKKKNRETNNTEKTLYIRIENSNDTALLEAIKDIITANKGSSKVVFVIGRTEFRQVLRLPIEISITDNSVKAIERLVGVSNIIAK